MATNSGVYYPSPEANAKFIEILEMFKYLSPAIHERLQNPDKGIFGGPKKASKVNQFKYYNNPEIKENGLFDQVQLLKEWYMTVNVLLNGEYDYNSPHDDYKSYVIDEIKDNIAAFKSIPNISGNIRIILTPLVDTQYNNALTKNIRLDRRKLYIINALNSLINTFAFLTNSTLPRIKSMALNTTTNGKRYNIKALNEKVFNYLQMMRNPITSLSPNDRSVKSLPAPPSGNTRLAVLKKGGKHRKHRITKKRSTHKKRTYKRKH
jgi:hypothetical protein